MNKMDCFHITNTKWVFSSEEEKKTTKSRTLIDNFSTVLCI